MASDNTAQSIQEMKALNAKLQQLIDENELELILHEELNKALDAIEKQHYVSSINSSSYCLA